MARKPRDYKAEERRRNELARQRGFKTRAAQRGAIERGEISALQPKRVRSKKTLAAQARRAQGLLSGSAVPKGPIPSFDELRRMVEADRAQQCRDWSAIHAASTVATYGWEKDDRRWKVGAQWVRANNATQKRKKQWIDAHGIDAYTDAYYYAFVDGEARYKNNRYGNGSEAMRLWFVEITGYLEADEYESRYGPAAL